MDPTPTPTPTPRPLSIKPSAASKLPIKRKNHHPSNPSTTAAAADDDDGESDGGDRNHAPPPFKFHRIWTEPDEIRFLQGLIASSSDALSFPRDLNLFYAKFSTTTSHPYTKSQLSEKLRRLRKKFRVVSSRLARGLSHSGLSPHDRALFELSKRLWHPDFSTTSPFGGGGSGSSKQSKSNLVGVKVSFSTNLSSPCIPAFNHNSIGNESNYNDDYENDRVGLGEFGFDVDGGVKLSEVNVEFDASVKEEELAMPSGGGSGGGGGVLGGGLGKVAAESVISVFDKCLREVRVGLGRDQGRMDQSGSSKERVGEFEKRWREQQVEELDVFARRLRLVLEHSLSRGS